MRRTQGRHPRRRPRRQTAETDGSDTVSAGRARSHPSGAPPGARTCAHHQWQHDAQPTAGTASRRPRTAGNERVPPITATRPHTPASTTERAPKTGSPNSSSPSHRAPARPTAAETYLTNGRVATARPHQLILSRRQAPANRAELHWNPEQTDPACTVMQAPRPAETENPLLGRCSTMYLEQVQDRQAAIRCSTFAPPLPVNGVTPLATEARREHPKCCRAAPRPAGRDHDRARSVDLRD
jgi:hypothetical protein